MLFNSFVFLLFAVGFYSIWYLLRSQSHRLILLIIGSFLFYSYWDWRYLFLLVGSGLIDFFAARAMPGSRHRRRLLVFSVVGNVGSLACFKYAAFAVDNLNWLLQAAGLGLQISGSPLPAVIPIGISFYTFQSMSYTIDVYRGRLQPTSSPIHFFAYLSMFPQLVAGPIERATHLMPQLAARRTPDAAQCWESWKLILNGFFKKCVIADSLAVFVNQAFAHSEAFDSGLYWWLIIAMFAMQIYCDFSGYSDIARGLAGLMGIQLLVNFDHPYISRSFAEFWRRWHISLSSWFRDYLYIPLGGNRKGRGRTYLNIWITMLVSGLWHGAAWTFVLWGAWHALMLSIEKLTSWPQRLSRLGRLGDLIAFAFVLSMTLVAWVFFRAEDIHQACYIIGRMVSPTALLISPLMAAVGSKVAMAQTGAIFAASIAWMAFWVGRDTLFARLRFPRLVPLFYAVIAVAVVFLRGPGSEFIYFQF